MATAREIIRAGYREANYKTALAEPTAEEFEEGLTLLQGVVDTVSGVVAGVRLRPWYVPYPQRTSSRSSRYPAAFDEDGPSKEQQRNPPINVRLLMANSDAETIYLQAHPDDGAVVEYVDVGHTGNVTLDANGALFGLTGSNETVTIDAVYPAGRNPPRRWLYRMDYGSWLEIVTLTLDTTLPFPRMFDDFFSTYMAIRLSARFGSEPRQSTVLRYQEMVSFIRAQWLMNVPSVGVDMGVPALRSFEDGSGFSDFGSGRVG